MNSQSTCTHNFSSDYYNYTAELKAWKILLAPLSQMRGSKNDLGHDLQMLYWKSMAEAVFQALLFQAATLHREMMMNNWFSAHVSLDPRCVLQNENPK